MPPPIEPYEDLNHEYVSDDDRSDVDKLLGRPVPVREKPRRGFSLARRTYYRARRWEVEKVAVHLTLPTYLSPTNADGSLVKFKYGESLIDLLDEFIKDFVITVGYAATETCRILSKYPHAPTIEVDTLTQALRLWASTGRSVRSVRPAFTWMCRFARKGDEEVASSSGVSGGGASEDDDSDYEEDKEEASTTSSDDDEVMTENPDDSSDDDSEERRQWRSRHEYLWTLNDICDRRMAETLTDADKKEIDEECGEGVSDILTILTSHQYATGADVFDEMYPMPPPSFCLDPFEMLPFMNNLIMGGFGRVYEKYSITPQASCLLIKALSAFLFRTFWGPGLLDLEPYVPMHEEDDDDDDVTEEEEGKKSSETPDAAANSTSDAEVWFDCMETSD